MAGIESSGAQSREISGFRAPSGHFITAHARGGLRASAEGDSTDPGLQIQLSLTLEDRHPPQQGGYDGQDNPTQYNFVHDPIHKPNSLLTFILALTTGVPVGEFCG